MTTTAQLLKDARALITDPARWTQGTYARDARHATVSPKSPQAVAWCAVGAIARVSQTDRDRVNACGALVTACEMLYGATTVETNDVRGHEAILTAFDQAFEGAR